MKKKSKQYFERCWYIPPSTLNTFDTLTRWKVVDSYDTEICVLDNGKSLLKPNMIIHRLRDDDGQEYYELRIHTKDAKMFFSIEEEEYKAIWRRYDSNFLAECETQEMYPSKRFCCKLYTFSHPASEIEHHLLQVESSCQQSVFDYQPPHGAIEMKGGILEALIRAEKLTY